MVMVAHTLGDGEEAAEELQENMRSNHYESLISMVQDAIQRTLLIEAYSVKTVSSMPKLGHMLVICRSSSSLCRERGKEGRVPTLQGLLRMNIDV